MFKGVQDIVTEEVVTNKTTVNPFQRGESQSNSVTEDENDNSRT